MAERPASSSTWERRLQAEWEGLTELIRLNPSRLTNLHADDATFFLTLRDTPAWPLHAALDGTAALQQHHRLRLEFPRFFPAMPLELSLERPVAHPNIDPDTGFVCLWESHRVSHTAAQAVHKTAAILGWQLRNSDPRHLMQPHLAGVAEERVQALQQTLRAPSLAGHVFVPEPAPAAAPRRPRLS